MFSNNDKYRKCSQKCDVTATLLVFQKNGTAAVLVTTPVDGGRVSRDTCGWRPCQSSEHLWIQWSCTFLLLQQICVDAGHVNENALLLGVKNSGGRVWNQSPKEDQTGCRLFKKQIPCCRTSVFTTQTHGNMESICFAQ